MENIVKRNEEILKALDENITDFDTRATGKRKRSSILKQPRNTDDELVDDVQKRKSINSKRRVSFAEKFQVKELCTGNIYDIPGKISPQGESKDVKGDNANSSYIPGAKVQVSSIVTVSIENQWNIENCNPFVLSTDIADFKQSVFDKTSILKESLDLSCIRESEVGITNVKKATAGTSVAAENIKVLHENYKSNNSTLENQPIKSVLERLMSCNWSFSDETDYNKNLQERTNSNDFSKQYLETKDKSNLNAMEMTCQLQDPSNDFSKQYLETEDKSNLNVMEITCQPQDPSNDFSKQYLETEDKSNLNAMEMTCQPQDPSNAFSKQYLETEDKSHLSAMEMTCQHQDPSNDFSKQYLETEDKSHLNAMEMTLQPQDPSNDFSVQYLETEDKSSLNAMETTCQPQDLSNDFSKQYPETEDKSNLNDMEMTCQPQDLTESVLNSAKNDYADVEHDSCIQSVKCNPLLSNTEISDFKQGAKSQLDKTCILNESLDFTCIREPESDISNIKESFEESSLAKENVAVLDEFNKTINDNNLKNQPNKSVLECLIGNSAFSDGVIYERNMQGLTNPSTNFYEQCVETRDNSNLDVMEMTCQPQDLTVNLLNSTKNDCDIVEQHSSAQSVKCSKYTENDKKEKKNDTGQFCSETKYFSSVKMDFTCEIKNQTNLFMHDSSNLCPDSKSVNKKGTIWNKLFIGNCEEENLSCKNISEKAFETFKERSSLSYFDAATSICESETPHLSLNDEIAQCTPDEIAQCTPDEIAQCTTDEIAQCTPDEMEMTCYDKDISIEKSRSSGTSVAEICSSSNLHSKYFPSFNMELTCKDTSENVKRLGFTEKETLAGGHTLNRSQFKKFEKVEYIHNSEKLKSNIFNEEELPVLPDFVFSSANCSNSTVDKNQTKYSVHDMMLTGKDASDITPEKVNRPRLTEDEIVAEDDHTLQESHFTKSEKLESIHDPEKIKSNMSHEKELPALPNSLFSSANCSNSTVDKNNTKYSVHDMMLTGKDTSDITQEKVKRPRLTEDEIFAEEDHMLKRSHFTKSEKLESIHDPETLKSNISHEKELPMLPDFVFSSANCSNSIVDKNKTKYSVHDMTLTGKDTSDITPEKVKRPCLTEDEIVAEEDHMLKRNHFTKSEKLESIRDPEKLKSNISHEEELPMLPDFVFSSANGSNSTVDKNKTTYSVHDMMLTGKDTSDITPEKVKRPCPTEDEIVAEEDYMLKRNHFTKSEKLESIHDPEKLISNISHEKELPTLPNSVFSSANCSNSTVDKNKTIYSVHNMTMAGEDASDITHEKFKRPRLTEDEIVAEKDHMLKRSHFTKSEKRESIHDPEKLISNVSHEKRLPVLPSFLFSSANCSNIDIDNYKTKNSVHGMDLTYSSCFPEDEKNKESAQQFSKTCFTLFGMELTCNTDDVRDSNFNELKDVGEKEDVDTSDQPELVGAGDIPDSQSFKSDKGFPGVNGMVELTEEAREPVVPAGGLSTKGDTDNSSLPEVKGILGPPGTPELDGLPGVEGKIGFPGERVPENLPGVPAFKENPDLDDVACPTGFGKPGRNNVESSELPEHLGPKDDRRLTGLVGPLELNRTSGNEGGLDLHSLPGGGYSDDNAEPSLPELKELPEERGERDCPGDSNESAIPMLRETGKKGFPIAEYDPGLLGLGEKEKEGFPNDKSDPGVPRLRELTEGEGERSFPADKSESCLVVVEKFPGKRRKRSLSGDKDEPNLLKQRERLEEGEIGFSGDKDGSGILRLKENPGEKVGKDFSGDKSEPGLSGLRKNPGEKRERELLGERSFQGDKGESDIPTLKEYLGEKVEKNVPVDKAEPGLSGLRRNPGEKRKREFAGDKADPNLQELKELPGEEQGRDFSCDKVESCIPKLKENPGEKERRGFSGDKNENNLLELNELSGERGFPDDDEPDKSKLRENPGEKEEEGSSGAKKESGLPRLRELPEEGERGLLGNKECSTLRLKENPGGEKKGLPADKCEPGFSELRENAEENGRNGFTGDKDELDIAEEKGNRHFIGNKGEPSLTGGGGNMNEKEKKDFLNDESEPGLSGLEEMVKRGLSGDKGKTSPELRIPGGKEKRCFSSDKSEQCLPGLKENPVKKGKICFPCDKGEPGLPGGVREFPTQKGEREVDKQEPGLSELRKLPGGKEEGSFDKFSERPDNHEDEEENEFEKIDKMRKKFIKASKIKDCLWTLVEMDDERAVFEILVNHVHADYYMYVPLEFNEEVSPSSKIAFKHVREVPHKYEKLGLAYFQFLVSEHTDEIFPFSADKLLDKLPKIVECALQAKSLIKDIWYSTTSSIGVTVDYSLPFPRLVVKISNEKHCSTFALIFPIDFKTYPNVNIIPEVEHIDHNKIKKEIILAALRKVSPGKNYLWRMTIAADEL